MVQSGGGAGCHDSCRYLRRVNAIRPGRCPPETQATGYAAQCVKSCDTDADCDAAAGQRRRRGDVTDPSHLFKCCSNGCGWTCQRPTNVFDGQPVSRFLSTCGGQN